MKNIKWNIKDAELGKEKLLKELNSQKVFVVPQTLTGVTSYGSALLFPRAPLPLSPQAHALPFLSIAIL